jgi:hypothetical protein
MVECYISLDMPQPHNSEYVVNSMIANEVMSQMTAFWLN